MCSSQTSLHKSSNDHIDQNTHVAGQINGRPVLQPNCNRVPSLERRSSLKITSKKPISPSPAVATTSPRCTRHSPSPPISPKTWSPKKKANNHGLGSSIEKVASTKGSINKGCSGAYNVDTKPTKLTSRNASCLLHLVVHGPVGSIAVSRREQGASMQGMRNMRFAHCGRKLQGSTKDEEMKVLLPVDSMHGFDEKRCNFITPNSDPIYVKYHDEEWGVPVYDDNVLFELLALTAAQVGSDWTSVLKIRECLRKAFSGFNGEMVASFGERKITSISFDYGMELSLVRGVVDNANEILKIKREFGSLSNYLWRYVNHKAICRNYKTCEKIPVKTSKSEAISKDLVKRGLRFVGPAVIHSFMQAAGLTNDHLLACPRRHFCSQLQRQQNKPTVGGQQSLRIYSR